MVEYEAMLKWGERASETKFLGAKIEVESSKTSSLIIRFFHHISSLASTMRIPGSLRCGLLLAAVLLQNTQALLTAPSRPIISSAASVPVAVNPDVSSITEPLCLDTARRMQRISVPVTTDIHPEGTVGISYVNWQPTKPTKNTPSLILIHGFDSSCLEYRRLGSRLAEQNINTYAVDLLGWGFTQLDGVASFSAQAKVQALMSFIDIVLGPDAPFVIVGASLGGAAAIETAAACNGRCQGLVLLDAQGFVDGIGPMALMPKPIAKLGVGVLKSVPLRSSANQMSYFDKEQYATDEAVVVGRLHCLRDGWDDALVSFMQSGGFSPSQKVPTIQGKNESTYNKSIHKQQEKLTLSISTWHIAPSLVLWGRQDGILDGNEFANKFVETLPDATLQWIEDCGHVPHLEQPQTTADAIASFMKERVIGKAKVASNLNKANSPVMSAVGVAGIAAALAALAADLLPVH